MRFEPAASEVKGKCANHLATEAPVVFVSLYGVQYGVCEEITCETNEILLIHQTSLFKRERRGDSHCVIANRLKRKQRQRVPASDRHGPCLRV